MWVLIPVRLSGVTFLSTLPRVREGPTSPLEPQSGAFCQAVGCDLGAGRFWDGSSIGGGAGGLVTARLLVQSLERRGAPEQGTSP